MSTTVRRPTPAELAILQVLWREGEATVRQIHEALGGERETRYTTVLKTLQIMSEKGLVAREESQRAHVYRAASSEERVQRELVGDLLTRVFEGSASRLVLHALAVAPASPDELAEIRRLLAGLEEPPQ